MAVTSLLQLANTLPNMNYQSKLHYPLSPLASVSRMILRGKVWKQIIDSYSKLYSWGKKSQNDGNTCPFFWSERDIANFKPVEMNMFWVKISYMNQLIIKLKASVNQEKVQQAGKVTRTYQLQSLPGAQIVQRQTPCHYWACAPLYSIKLWNVVYSLLLLKFLVISLRNEDQEVWNSIAVLWKVLKIVANHFCLFPSVTVHRDASYLFCFSHAVLTGTSGFTE